MSGRPVSYSNPHPRLLTEMKKLLSGQMSAEYRELKKRLGSATAEVTGSGSSSTTRAPRKLYSRKK
jgi:hypothetical protein